MFYDTQHGGLILRVVVPRVLPGYCCEAEGHRPAGSLPAGLIMDVMAMADPGLPCTQSQVM